MNRERNLQILIESISNLKDIPLEQIKITENTPLKSLELDSLDIVEMQMYYEDKTGIETKDPTSPIVTVKDLLDILE
jgi:acyl carrier protein